jgi:hypothetical protein
MVIVWGLEVPPEKSCSAELPQIIYARARARARRRLGPELPDLHGRLRPSISRFLGLGSKNSKALTTWAVKEGLFPECTGV